MGVLSSFGLGVKKTTMLLLLLLLLPTYYTADWFFSIFLCVSLGMLRGKITSLNCLAVKNCAMSNS